MLPYLITFSLGDWSISPVFDEIRRSRLLFRVINSSASPKAWWWIAWHVKQCPWLWLLSPCLALGFSYHNSPVYIFFHKTCFHFPLVFPTFYVTSNVGKYYLVFWILCIQIICNKVLLLMFIVSFSELIATFKIEKSENPLIFALPEKL